uniref:Uncharacterized protein n=2 Tax=Trichogramma kaykai TaxID=54128 RepID=A0ABD2XL04_9HYME
MLVLNSDSFELKSLRNSVNWGIETERKNFRHRLAELISGCVPSSNLNLTAIFSVEEMDWILTNSINDRPGQQIIEFVAKAGYKYRPDVEEIDVNGEPWPQRTTLVHLVAKSADQNGSHRLRDEIISDLLKIYGNFHVNYIDDSGLTHFHAACAFGRLNDDSIERYLNEARVNPNHCMLPQTGDTPLLLALNQHPDFKNRSHVLSCLLKAGADPNAINIVNGFTPLHVICQKSWTDRDMVNEFFNMCEALSERQVNVDAQDYFGNTPLHMAAYCRNDEAVKALLKLGANPNIVNSKGLTLLHVICHVGPDDEDLMDSCFEINKELQLHVRDEKDRTSLELALSHGYRYLAESLLRHGCDPNSANSQGLTPLHVICNRKEDDDDLLKTFYRVCDELNHVVQVDARDKSGQTPLHYALANGCKERMVQKLLHRRAEPHAVDAEGSTALHAICRRKQDDDLVEIFFDYLDDLQQAVRLDARDNTGRTPLEWAVANYQSKNVEELLRRGADVSGFVFPSETEYDETFPSQTITDNESKLKLVCRILVCLDWLTIKYYRLTTNDFLTIVKFFVKHELFLDSKDLTSLKEFANRAKNIQINNRNSITSVYDLIVSEPVEAAKLILIQDSLYFPPNPIELCEMPLCEMISRRFFLNLSVYPFWELIHRRLPLEICEIILGKSMNKDLSSIILAATCEGKYK